jgi:hypothetical protein
MASTRLILNLGLTKFTKILIMENNTVIVEHW